MSRHWRASYGFRRTGTMPTAALWVVVFVGLVGVGTGFRTICTSEPKVSGEMNGPNVMGVDDEGPYTVHYNINKKELTVRLTATGEYVGNVSTSEKVFVQANTGRFVRKSAVYMPTWDSLAIAVLDIRDPKNIGIEMIGKREDPGPVMHLGVTMVGFHGKVEHLGVVGDRLYVLHSSDPCFEVYDVSDPFKPTLLRVVPAMCRPIQVRLFEVVDGFDGDVVAFLDMENSTGQCGSPQER
eukprot:Sspe_Gene.35297::Locus_17113_Transcript_1_1_Confidence_1.000_Length_4456::g.35297::m.35297